jgi:hypothetical protein
VAESRSGPRDRRFGSGGWREEETPALPDDLPEWKQVDFDASVWMLRHIPKVGERAHTIGSTATFMKNGFRVVYIPKIGFDVNIKQISEEWLPENLFGTQVLRDRLKTIRQSDGTVVLSCGEKLGDDALWFGIQLYRLQAFELFLADK